MSAVRSLAQKVASRANGARSSGPTTEAGKARSARNGTRHGLRGGPFALLPDEDPAELDRLHASVTNDWRPRDAYERRWVMELVAAMWRQDRLRGLELATLAAAAEERPLSEASLKKLLTFARYGTRIDKDIGRALQALRVLRDRPDTAIGELQDGTSEPGECGTTARHCANDVPARTSEPGVREACNEDFTNELAPRTREPERPPASPAPAPVLNRQQRRRIAALARRENRAA